MNPTNQDWRAQRRAERWQRRQERWANGQGCWSGRDGNPFAGAILGLLLVGGGLLFLLRNLGIFYFDSIWQFWPVILIALGLSKLAGSRHSGEVVSGVILTAVGGLFLARTLGFIYGDVWRNAWPVFLIALGVWLLLRNFGMGDPPNGGSDGTGGLGGPQTGFPAGGIGDRPDSSANRIQAETVFGSIIRKIQAQDFEGGKIAVVFGGADIDLRGSATTHREMTLRTDAVFGGIDVIIPDTWQVDMRGGGFFGGFEDLTHRSPNSTGPRLIVAGGAVFGGVTIRS